MKRTVILFALVASLSSMALAQNRNFAINPQQANVNTATVESETVLENFTGRTSNIQGSIVFNPQAKTGSGTIVVNGASIDTGIPLRNEHMRSTNWFNFDARPEIRFVTTAVKNTVGDTYEVTGNLTINGVTKAVTVPATLRFTPSSDATRAARLQGDVVALSTEFKIKLTDFNITNRAPNQVSNEVTIRLRVIGTTGQ